MPEEYEMEELADMAVGELREFINTESQLVEEEHELHSKLLSWDYVIAHLDERIPENMTHLHDLNAKVTDELMAIRDLIESGRLKDLRIEKEEVQILEGLKEEIRHRDWKAVRKDVDLETKEEKHVLRLEIHELKKLHSKFKALMRLMERSSLRSAINEDFTVPRQKEEYERLEEYYFLQIYKFVRAYEGVFRHLWEKEKMLSRKLKKESKRMR